MRDWNVVAALTHPTSAAKTLEAGIAVASLHLTTEIPIASVAAACRREALSPSARLTNSI